MTWEGARGVGGLVTQKSCAKSPPWAGQGNGWDWLNGSQEGVFSSSQKIHLHG